MAKNIRLTVRDRLILEHIHQFDLSTPNILKNEFFENKKMAAVTSTTRRLREHGLISSHRIIGRRSVYYRLTVAGGSAVNLEVKPDAFGFHKFGSRFGMLHFICMRSPDVHRIKCTSAMLSKLIAIGTHRIPRVDFYMAEKKQGDDEQPITCLGFAVVDLRSKQRRLVDRCVNHSRKFIHRGWFAEVMQAGRFEITVLTGSETKQKDLLLTVPRELRRRLRRDIFRAGLKSQEQFPIKFNVVFIPELDYIVPF